MHLNLSPKTGLALLLSISAFWVPGVSAQFQETKPTPSVVTISVGTPGPEAQTVPATLFGSFLEPIGDSIHQGLSAEVLINGSLESGLWNYANLQKMIQAQPALAVSSNSRGLPYPWLPVDRAAGQRFEIHRGSAANSWQSVEIMGYPGAQVGILQQVYLPIQRTTGYTVSLYARHLEGSPKITILLRKHGTQDVVAKATITAPSADWTKYSATLKVKRDAVKPLEPVDFAVEVAADERIELDELSLQPDDAIDGMDPDVIAMSKAMNLTELRFGGNFSSQYHWREGIGPLDKRLVEENGAWGIPEYNTFGTDEFLDFCKMIHAVPQIDLNMGSGTPEEAADWVRYIHGRYPGKIIYELGNELYGNWQTGYLPVDQIAERTIAFSQAVRAVDPNAEIIATGSMPQRFARWNAAQLTTPPGTFDLLSTHFIRETNQVQLPDASPEFVASAAYALPVELGRDLHQMQAQLDAVPALKNRVHFAMDEWLFNSRAGDRAVTNLSPSSKNEGGGLMVAGVFNTLIRNSRIVPISEMTGLMEFAGIWKERQQVYATPAYYVFRLYSSTEGDTVLPVTTDSGAYEVRGGVEGFTDMKDIPFIDVIATMTPDHTQIKLFCINRDLNRDLPVRIDLGPFAAHGTAKVEQLTAASRYDGNDEIHPQNVVPHPSTISLSSQGAVAYTLPHESLTIITFNH